MPSFTFKDSENLAFQLIKPGGYVAEVKGVEFGLQSGGKTNGSDNMELKLAIEGTDSTIRETLIFHPSCEWKIDTFVKAFNLLLDGGRAPAKGESIEFTERMLVGLRGHVVVANEPGKKDPSKKFNCIAVFVTNKPKLAKASAIDPDDVGF